MSETEPGTEILRETRGHVAILTINRPEARNAINAAVSTQLAAALDEIEHDKDVWVVVLTGAGDKAFSAGMDLKAFASGEGAGIMNNKHGFAGIGRRSFPKPIIAAVNGPALAGGFEIVLSCDLVVAVEHASFGIPEVKRGLLAAGGGLIRLPKRVPMAIALELAMTGDPIDAQRAFDLGLVNRVVPPAELMDEALALAERITPNAPLSVRRSKAVMYAAAQVSEEAGWEISEEATRIVFRGPDAREGPNAFAEKRPPNWEVE
jgi:enoyl-CoA hydratase/carnithine racemase